MRESRICSGVYSWEKDQTWENQEYLYSWGRLAWKYISRVFLDIAEIDLTPSCPQDLSFPMMWLSSFSLVCVFRLVCLKIHCHLSCPKRSWYNFDQVCSKLINFRVLYKHILDTMLELIFILGCVELPHPSQDSCPFARCEPKQQLVKKQFCRCGFFSMNEKVCNKYMLYMFHID